MAGGVVKVMHPDSEGTSVGIGGHLLVTTNNCDLCQYPERADATYHYDESRGNPRALRLTKSITPWYSLHT